MKAIALVVIAAAILLLVRPDLLDKNTGIDSVTIKVVIPEPCRVSIEVIRAMNIASRDADELAKFYTAFANVLDKDTENWVGVSINVRLAHQRCGKLTLADKEIYGKYPGLANAVDETIAASIGSRQTENGEYEPVVLDTAKKNNLAQAARAIAWAVQN